MTSGNTVKGSSAAEGGGTSCAPGYARLCIALLTLLGFSLGCSEFVVIGIQPELADSLNIPLEQAGMFMSAFSVTYAAATPALALGTGRVPRFRLLVAYMALFILGNAVSALASSFATLLAARVLIGLVSGALLAVGVTYIPELVGMKRTSMCVSIVYAAFSVAMVVSTSAGRLLAASIGWHYALVGTLVLSVAVSAALVAVLPREGAADVPAGVREQLPLLEDPRCLCGMAIFVFGVGSVYTFYGYVTPYLEDVLGFDAVSASAVLMAYGAATFASNLLSGLVDTHFGVRALVATFPLQGALLFALYCAGPAPTAVPIILAIGLSMYLVSVPCISLFMTTAAREHPQALTLASSLEPTAFNVGIAFGTAVGGTVISNIGIAYVGAVGAVFSLVACGLAAVTVSVTRKRKRD